MEEGKEIEKEERYHYHTACIDLSGRQRELDEYDDLTCRYKKER